MRIIILLAIAFVCCIQTHAGEPYAVSNISAALLKNANVVKRMEHQRFEIHSLTSTTLKYKYAFTILNENAEKWAQFVEHYDKLRKIVSIEGNLYDGNGKLLKKLKSKDIQDMSAVSDISLIEDNRVKRHNFYHRVFPYTIEYEVEVRYNNTFSFPPWYTQEGENLAVEQTKFTVVFPADYQLRYRAFNYKGDPVSGTEKNARSLTWEITNVPAIKKEPNSPKWHELTTAVIIAPTDFQIDDYRGNMTSWKEFGKFLYTLGKGRDVLPDNIKQQVKQLTANAKTDVEKVKVLYDYLQKNTRYISIQLGLGGWQPFEASYVATKGYGDCKALSNYMYSLLKEAGINSYYTLIRAGNQENITMPDFPSNQFNHAILCVPVKNDTLWLECTSQTAPAGYMGDFTGNRKALLLTEEGGVLVDTKKYLVSENLQTRFVKASIDETGLLYAAVRTRYRNMQQDYLHQVINVLSKDRVKEYLQELLDLPTYNVNNFKYTEKKDVYPEIEEELDLYVDGYATITGKRLFVSPNLLNKSSVKLNTEDRKYDICYFSEYKDIDTVVYELPKGYTAEAMPQDVSIKTKYGSYSSTVKLKENSLTYIRVREQYSGRYNPKEYNDIVKYFSEIYKADRSKIVLVKSVTEQQPVEKKPF